MSIQSIPWRYFIVDGEGRTYRVENGLVLAAASRKSLHYTPLSWQEVTVGYERDLEKWGVMRTFTLPLGFVRDGAQILRNLIYKGNFEKKVYLLIQKQYLALSPTTYKWYYDLFYKGEFDLTTAVDDEDKVTVEIKEGGLTQDMEANKDTVYEIPCDEITVRMDGIILFQSASYFITNGLLLDNLGGHTIEARFYGSEAITSLGAVSQRRFKTGNSAANLWNSNEYFLSPQTEDTTATVTWDFYMTPELASGIGAVFGTSIVLQLWTSENDSTATDNILQTFGGGDPLLIYNQKLHFQGSATVPIPKNRRAILYMSASQNREFTYFRYEADPIGKFDIKYTYRAAPTWVTALYPLTLFQRLIAKISPSATATSALLKLFQNFCISSGDAIRGIPGAVIKIKYSDFYKSINAILCTSENIQGKTINIDTFQSAFVEADIIPLGQPRELSIRDAVELLVNTVKVGFPDQDYGDVNGKQEFNTTQTRTSEVRKIVKELDLTSYIRGDGYGAEFLRINLAGKTTTDSSADNDAFFLDVDFSVFHYDSEHGIYYDLYRENYDVITGVLTPATIFNVRLSPGRILERQRPLLNSLFYGFEGTKLVYQSSDKNRELHTEKAGVIVDEDSDFIITTAGRVFKPKIFDFEPMTPANLVEQLQVNTNRCFSFQHWNGVTLTGFGIKLGIAINTLETQKYLLLSSASNDLTLLADG